MSNVRKRDFGGITNTLVPAPSPTKSIQLPEATERELDECFIAITAANAKKIDSIFEIGRNLKKAQALLAKHGNGVFEKWVKNQCGFTASCARNYLRAERTFGSKDPKSLCGTFTLEALYYLSREATPKPAITEALRQAKKGNRIPLKKAQDLVAEYTVEECNGQTSDQTEWAADTEEGTGEPDTATDTEEGTDKEAEPPTEPEESLDEDFIFESIDDQSPLGHFVRSIKGAIAHWSRSCSEQEKLRFPQILCKLADELERG